MLAAPTYSLHSNDSWTEEPTDHSLFRLQVRIPSLANHSPVAYRKETDLALSFSVKRVISEAFALLCTQTLVRMLVAMPPFVANLDSIDFAPDSRQRTTCGGGLCIRKSTCSTLHSLHLYACPCGQQGLAGQGWGLMLPSLTANQYRHLLHHRSKNIPIPTCGLEDDVKAPPSRESAVFKAVRRNGRQGGVALDRANLGDERPAPGPCERG